MNEKMDESEDVIWNYKATKQEIVFYFLSVKLVIPFILSYLFCYVV